MKKQFCWNILAIILLCICLPIGLCDKYGQQQQHRSAIDRASFSRNGGGGVGSAGRSGKFRSTQGIPLRDDNDYIHKDDEQTDTINDDEYDDDYEDGDEGDVRNEAYDDDDEANNNNDDENDSSPEIVEQAHSARTQIIQRPKELTETELNALLLLKSSPPTPTTSGDVDTGVVDSADATAPSSIETCPKECSCLNDFMTCTRPHLKHLPKVPHFIQSLELPQNNYNVEMCEQGIRNLPNLVDLKLNENKLDRIPIFHGLSSLEILILTNNQIHEISLTALQALPKLMHLDLSRNMIVTIGPNSFPKQNTIQKLFLNNNQIMKLDRRAFEPLIDLVELKANKNRINQLPTGLFTKLKKLKKLSLNGNELRANLQYATFSNLTALTILKLRNNFIDELITGVFHGLDNLSLLDLANNQLNEIQKGGLLNITSLTKLNLANNTIHTIGKSCWEFTQRITQLDLSDNRLNEITIGTFEMLSKLRELDLHGNQISSISSGALNATYNLESLDLSRNRISATIEDSFGPFAALTRLDYFNLNGNNIKAINKNAFLGLISLTRLDLSSNNITTIQDGAFDQRTLPELLYLDINSTDLICDCHLTWFYFWAKNIQPNGNKKAASGERYNGIDVRCAFPFSLRNKRLLQLHKDNLTCYDTPKPQMADEPKSPILAIKGTNITIECTAFVTVGTDIVFSWKHDNMDIDSELIETKIRQKDESRLRVKERMVERRREVNRSPMRMRVSAPKVPLTSSSVSKMSFDDSDDDYEGDDEEAGGEQEEESEYMESDDSIDDVIATVEDIEAAIPMNSTVATSRLHLRNVDAKTVGRYQCIASNDFGKAYSQKFKVTVASYPVFTKQPTNVTVKTSERVILTCAVDGDPKPQIYWQFNFGNDFPAARERRMQIMDNDESFIIDNAKASDRGVYTCTAENPAGIITANVTVDIIEPMIYVKPVEHKEVMIGENIVLQCQNGESALSEVRWFKNSKLLSPSIDESRYVMTKENQLLIVMKSTEDDAGLYTCELENKLGIEKSLIQLKVRTKPIVTIVNVESYTHDEITAIIIVTVVFCAIGTSIIWIVVMYKTKNDHGCGGGGGARGGDDVDGCGNNDRLTGGIDTNDDNTFTKDNILKSVSMLPMADDKPLQAMRTATISRCHGMLRSNSGGSSSCGHSSIGPNEFRRYKDDSSMGGTTPLHRPHLHRNGTDTEEDEALLGAAYFDRYGKAVKCSDNDSFIVQMMDDGADGNSSSHHDTSAGNTTTAECGEYDDGQHSSTKTKTSTSLSSSCHSIPALPLNSSHEFDLNRSQCNDSIASSSSPSYVSNSNSMPNSNKPVIHPIAMGKPKPTIQTNKLNELMSTFK